MRARHNFGPENGPQHTAANNQTSENTDFSLRTAHIQGPEFNDLPVYSGPDLVGFLRWWADHYDWDKPDFRTTRLRLELAFEDSVTGAFYQFIADGQGALASLIKDEFSDLMEMTQSLDLMYAERIDTRHEMMKLEEMKSQVAELLYGLATMLENGYRAQAKSQQPESNGSEIEWVTYKEAAGLLGVRKSTVSKWVKKGRLTDNGEKGRKKRLSKTCVLLAKQEIDDEYLKNDADELRRDTGRIR
jgi:excisionase family DNA binding protein